MPAAGGSNNPNAKHIAPASGDDGHAFSLNAVEPGHSSPPNRLHWAGVAMILICLTGVAAMMRPSDLLAEWYMESVTEAQTICCEGETRRILEIDSYDGENPWTSGITAGVRKIVDQHNIDLYVMRMDTKRRASEQHKLEAAAKAKRLIDDIKPHVIITSDDNAAKYVVVPYLKNTNIPVVFVGVNWTAEEYGFPCPNVTGQIEVALVRETIELLGSFGPNERVGLLASDVFTSHKDAMHYQIIQNKPFTSKVFVKTFTEWQAAFLQMQDEVDVILMADHQGIEGWDADAAAAFIENNCRIPIGTVNQKDAPYALLGIVRNPQAIGEWAGATAIRILHGTPPYRIPLTHNRKGRLILNLRVADRLGLKFPPQMMRSGEVLN